MNPSNPTQILNQRQLKGQPPTQQAAPMPPPGMPLPAPEVPTPATGNAYAPGQPTVQPPIQQAAPMPPPMPSAMPPTQGQPFVNNQSQMQPMISRPQPNAPMKPPMPTNGRPMSTARKPTPMG